MILVIILLILNTKVEYFNNILISKSETVLKDSNGNNINPTVWYKLDNNGLDSSGNNYHLRANGTINYDSTDFIKGSHSASFNGIPTNFFSLTSGNLINLNNRSYSITFWIKPLLATEINNYLWFFNLGSVAVDGQRLHVGVAGDKIRFHDNGRGDLSVTPSKNIVNQWVHIGLIYNHSTGLREIYLNGVVIASRTFIQGLQTNNLFYLGGINSGGYFGKVDDFRIYSGIALNEEQVYELYAGYKKIGEVIDTSTNCSANMNPSGPIIQIPDTNMNINVISTIIKRNDNIYMQSFGNGIITYNLTFSRYFNDDYIPTNLFLRNNKLTAFTIDNYNNNGDYIGIFTTNLPEELAFGLIKYPQKGEFIHIRLPSNINLKRYGFRADPQWVSRAPGTWALYAGSRLLETSNVNSTLLVNNTTRLNNNSYCTGNLFTYIHDIGDNKTSGNELLFIFTSLANSTSPNSPGRVLSFMELLLYS
jgi:hypothetical protein